MYVCMCSVADISATVTPISVKFCMTVDIGPGHEVSPFVGYPKRPPKSQILTANILKRQVATLHVKWA